MTRRDYGRFKTTNLLLILLGSLYSLFFVAVNLVTFQFGIYPILIYSIPCLFGAVWLLFALMPRRAQSLTKCSLVSPTLEGSITAICQNSGIGKLPQLEIQFLPNASVYEELGCNHISLGLPLILDLTKGELDFVLAHEVAHQLYGDTTWGRVAGNLEQRVKRVGSLFSRRSTALILLPFRPLFLGILRSLKKTERDCEFSADEFAARFAGTESAIRALDKLESVDFRWTIFVDRWLHFVLESNVHIEIVSLYEAFGGSWLHIEKPRAGRSSVSNDFDSHPTIDERISRISAAEPVPRPGTESFHDISNQSEISAFFYSFVVEPSESALLDVGEGYLKIGAFVKNKYSSSLELFRWRDLSEITRKYGLFSSEFYRITLVDDGPSERKLFVFLVSYLIFEASHQQLRLGYDFTPTLELEEGTWELGACVESLFSGPQPDFLGKMTGIGISVDEFTIVRT